MKTLLTTTVILSFLLVSPAAFTAPPYWQSLGPGHANWVNMIKVRNDGVLFVATDLGGVYKSADGGASYQALNSGIINNHIIDIAIDPDNGDIIYIGTRGGLFKTVDGGVNWVSKRSGIGGPSSSVFTAPFSSILIDPSNTQTVFAAVGLPRTAITKTGWVKTVNKGSIYKSIDAGENWLKINTGTSNIPGDALIYRMEMGATVSELYVATQYGIYKSIDGGVNWLAKNTGLPSSSPYTKYIKRDSLVDTTLYLTLLNGSVYRSIDSGDSWAPYNNGLPVSGINFYRLETDALGQLYVTGSTYNPVATKGIWKKANATSDWVKIAGPDTSAVINYGWRGGLSNPQSISVDPSDPAQNTVYISGSTTLFKTVNANDLIPAWDQIYTTIINSNEYTHRGINTMGACHTVAIDPKNNKRIYLDTGDHGLQRSENGGQTWQVANDGMLHHQHIYDILIDPLADVVYVSDSMRETTNRGGVAKSINHGVSWTQIKTGLPDKTVYSLAMDTTSPTSNRVLYAGQQLGGVYRSTDGGQGWANWSTGLPVNATVYTLLESPVQPSLIYAAVRNGTADGGLYKRGKNDASWTLVNTDFVLRDVYDVAINPQDPQTIYVATRRTSSSVAGVWKNSESGSNDWMPLISDPVWITALAIDPLNTDSIIAASMTNNFNDLASGQGLLKSSADGLLLENIEKNIPVTRFMDIVFDPASPERIYTCALGSSLYTHTDLAGHWSLDDGSGASTFSDESGLDNHGTLIGNPGWIPGKVGDYALDFDGIDDKASVSNVPLHADSGYVISAWVMPKGAHDDWAPIVFSNGGGIRFRLQTNNIQFVIRNAGFEFKQLVSTISLPDNQWSMVTAVYDSNTDEMRLYINGELDNVAVAVGGLYADIYNGNVTFSDIGGNSDNSRMFTGSLDDIRIYTTAYDNEAVSRLHQRSSLVGDGDINGDGTVNAIDALLATRATLGLITLNATQITRGDVAPVGNPNGYINVGDIAVIIGKAIE